MVVALVLAVSLATQGTTHRPLVWGGDAEGGAPFVEADPRDPSRVRGFDVEDAPARRARHAVTLPYFEFREVLAVRPADAGRIRGLADLRGRRVATLGSTIAYDLLMQARDSTRSEEHTSELQSQSNIVCRLLLEKKKK